MTSKDIAKIAGVSQATVSRCLNDSPLVKDVTKKHILEIARKYNFTMNANAQSLKTSKSGTIGIVFPEHFVDFNVNMYFADLFNYLRTNLDNKEYDLLALSQKKETNSLSNVERIIRNKKVDGLIILQSYASKVMSDIQHNKIPCVFIDDENLHEDSNTVFVDHYRGGFLVGDYLARKGKKRIGCVTLKNEVPAIAKRTDGFLTALTDAGIEVESKDFYYGNLTYESGFKVVQDNIEEISKYDAIFVQNDVMAMGVVNGLRSFKIRIPEDISIVGYDDLKIASWFYPALTTIHIPNLEISNKSCDMLFSILKDENCKCERIVVEPKLIERDSV